MQTIWNQFSHIDCKMRMFAMFVDLQYNVCFGIPGIRQHTFLYNIIVSQISMNHRRRFKVYCVI